MTPPDHSHSHVHSHAALSAEAARAALGLRDLSDPASGPHAMQRLLDAIVSALRERWGCAVRLHREPPVVSIDDNYDALGYPPEGAARDARYTRYLGPDLLLRTQTSAAIPRLLRDLARSPGPLDVLLVCPGLVYRRDAIDRLHTGEPHQVDLWRVRSSGSRLGEADLRAMLASVQEAALPGWTGRTLAAAHPYTERGRQLDVRTPAGEWIEVGECGLAARALLERSGLGPEVSGLAMGLGLDRLLMLRKGIEDIRLLRSEDPRVCAQMRDLAPYRPVSAQPPARRDLSLALAPGATDEDLGDRVRAALGPDASCVEDVRIVTTTPQAALPASALARIGLLPGQINALVRIVIRHPTRTLTSAEANALRNRVYAALHQGTRAEWA